MTMETMDTIEQPKEVPAPEFKHNPKNPKVFSDKFTDNGGLYDMVVKKMLQTGHEGELFSWLKDLSLLRANMNCPNENCNGKNLTWSPSRRVDRFSWICTDCKKIQPVRDSSFFLGIKSDLKIIVQIIVAWCSSISEEVVVSYLSTKHHIVKKTYYNLGKVVESYVNKHINDWVLGGPEKILIIDEFPSGYMTEHLINTPVIKKRNNSCHTILCMAEVDKIPPRMWIHIINAEPTKNAKNEKTETKCGMVEEALKEICAHAKPGSILIANKRARCCNYESLKELSNYKVISLEDLQIHNPPGKNELLSNLETIWQTGIGICEDIQETTRANGLQYLYVHLWKQRFATTTASAFENILQHIAEYFPFT